MIFPLDPNVDLVLDHLSLGAYPITDIDPIKFNLIFERFLNPDRISMPDFDIDFVKKKEILYLII